AAPFAVAGLDQIRQLILDLSKKTQLVNNTQFRPRESNFIPQYMTVNVTLTMFSCNTQFKRTVKAFILESIDIDYEKIKMDVRIKENGTRVRGSGKKSLGQTTTSTSVVTDYTGGDTSVGGSSSCGGNSGFMGINWFIIFLPMIIHQFHTFILDYLVALVGIDVIISFILDMLFTFNDIHLIITCRQTCMGIVKIHLLKKREEITHLQLDLFFHTTLHKSTFTYGTIYLKQVANLQIVGLFLHSLCVIGGSNGCLLYLAPGLKEIKSGFLHIVTYLEELRIEIYWIKRELLYMLYMYLIMFPHYLYILEDHIKLSYLPCYLHKNASNLQVALTSYSIDR
ncbi:hypothetical protein ACJX0J_030945, partial [Zea mays]